MNVFKIGKVNVLDHSLDSSPRGGFREIYAPMIVYHVQQVDEF